MTSWLWVAVMGAGTFAIRLSFLALVRHTALPEGARRALAYVLPAVLAAVIAQSVLYDDGGGLRLTFGNDRLSATLAAAALAAVTRSVWLTVAGGMAALWLLQRAG